MAAVFHAKVQYWNLSSISVLCPFCNGTHHHHFNQDMYRGNRRRIADCPGRSFQFYEMLFPFDDSTGEISFYVDKSNERYVAIGAQLDPNDKRLPATDGGGTGNGMLRFERRKWTEGEEMHILDNTDEGFRRLKEVFGGDEDETSWCLKIQYAVSSLVRGNESWLKEYLDSSAEATLFLNGVDTLGNTALHLAACESWPEMVRLLLCYDVDVNSKNSGGRTPLMEAALWGRLQNVFLLLQKGADTETTDDQGYSAIDFAIPSQKNDDERHDRFERFLNTIPFKAYDIHQRNAERRQIVSILKEKEEKAAVRSSLVNDSIEEFKFLTILERRSVALVKEIPISKMNKAVARLIFPSTGKHNKFMPVDAMSGWKHGGSAEDEVVINGRNWTPAVIKLAALLQYRLPADNKKDHGLSGQYYASHAEKQLIAYFVNTHVVSTADPLHLSGAIPPVMISQAQIIVNKEKCWDCEAFVAAVNAELKLGLQVESIQNSLLGA